MKREDVVKELKRRGYRAEKYEAVKNGVACKGILFRCENGVSPVVYTDEMIKKEEQGENCVAHIANLIVGIYETFKEPDFDVNFLLDREFVLSHMRVGLQKTSEQHLEKGYCKFSEMETYLCVIWKASGQCSTKLTPEYLKRVGISQTEAWEIGYKNTFEDTKIFSMASLELEDFGVDPRMYIFTNESGYLGASAILNSRALKEFDKKSGNETHKFFMLPSSIHEVIVIPYDDEYELEELSQLVREVNKTRVRPEEQLADKAYIIEV